jgi:hypothetical protein
MRGKILFITGIAVGYVLGAKAGRERYEQIARSASKLWNDPRVQDRVETVEEFVKDRTPEVVEAVAGGVKTVAGKVSDARRGSSSSSSRSTTRSRSTASKSGSGAKKPSAAKKSSGSSSSGSTGSSS